MSRPVPRLVHDRAIDDPNALAVASGDWTLSYGELDAHANRLAHELREIGVTAERTVALVVERSAAMVVGALAILKAGGAYLPIDPATPPDRRDFMLEESGCSTVLTTDAHPFHGPSEHVLLIDRRSQRDALPPPCDIAIGDLAYVIYTSGSSGRPKGVAITHANLLNLIDWHRRAFRVTARDRATQIAAVGFDASVWEVWPYLAAGASVHLPDHAVRRDPSALRDWLIAENISITFVPTPLAERLLSLAWPADVSLRLMLTGADTLHVRPPRSLPFDLINNYGPTECTVVATSGQVAAADVERGLPAIGRPIDNTAVYVLDEHGCRVAAGTPGEIYIGGAAVGRGYVNRPGLTAERFVPDRFGPVPGARLYRTGDLGRYRQDGQLVFLGRIDDQINVLGYRIEPAEIVAQLRAHPELLEAAVIAREMRDGQMLVAYVVPSRGVRPSRQALQDFLRRRLPDYMVPSIFVALDALPLSESGKVDHAALPLPTAHNSIGDAPSPGPRTVVETRVAAIMAALMDLPQIGIHVNFFQLGGHSLLATQLIARIRDALGVELGLRRVFEAPTVAGLAAEIEHLLADGVAGPARDDVQPALADAPAMMGRSS